MNIKDKWFKCNNFTDMTRLLIQTYKKYDTPWHLKKKESSNLIAYLYKFNRLGGLTTDSQLGTVVHKTKHYDFCIQKAYVTFIINNKKAMDLYHKFKKKYHICLFSKDKLVKTNITKKINPNLTLILHKSGELVYRTNINIKINNSIPLLKNWVNSIIYNNVTTNYYTVFISDKVYGKNKIFKDLIKTLQNI